MPVTDNRLSSVLVIKYKVGTASNGAPILKTKSLNNVRPGADHESLYRVASALFSLSQHPMTDVILRDNTELLLEDEEE